MHRKGPPDSVAVCPTWTRMRWFPLRATSQPRAWNARTTPRALRSGRRAVRRSPPPAASRSSKASPLSARNSRHARMASRTSTRASSLVAPRLTHPGMAGHSNTQTPSSSRSMLARNVIRPLNTTARTAPAPRSACPSPCTPPPPRRGRTGCTGSSPSSRPGPCPRSRACRPSVPKRSPAPRSAS